MIGTLRTWLRSQQWYLRIRRALQFGVARSLRRSLREPVVLRTAPVPTATTGPCEVHLLTDHRDWQLALWALKTFYHFARVDYPLHLHAGSLLSETILGHMKFHFPQAFIHELKAADAVVDAELSQRGLTKLQAARRSDILFRKITDVLLLGSSDYVLLLDSDVLFFAPPLALLEVVAAGQPRIVFNRDFVSSYILKPEDVRTRFGLELPPEVNSGIGIISRSAAPLEVVESWLREGFPIGSYAEQTLWALLAARCGGPIYLPGNYATMLGPADPARLVARHYVNPVRYLLFDEGIPFLRRHTPAFLASSPSGGR